VDTFSIPVAFDEHDVLLVIIRGLASGFGSFLSRVTYIKLDTLSGAGSNYSIVGCAH